MPKHSEFTLVGRIERAVITSRVALDTDSILTVIKHPNRGSVREALYDLVEEGSIDSSRSVTGYWCRKDTVDLLNS